MLELAQHCDQEPLSLSEIALSQELSGKYLEALLSSLRAAGLVRTQRGPQGGYALARAPETITLRDIFDVLEGREPYVPCTASPEVCHRWSTCATQAVWARMYRASMEILESTTLADLVVQARGKCLAPVSYDI